MGSPRRKTPPERLVVCNTGPLLHLYEAKALELLPLAGRICIPQAVDEELSRLLPQWPRSKSELSRINVLSLSVSSAVEAALWLRSGILDAGEAEAIALAQELNADWFLTDDSTARIFAETKGLECHGSLGLVLWAAAVGHFGYSEAREALERLAASSLWISQSILEEAHEALRQMFGD